MTKQELMETYTAEQLAEMVVEFQGGKENKAFKVSDNKNYQNELEEFLKESPIQSTIDRICKDITKQKNNAMAMEFTRIIGELLRENGVCIRFSQAEIGEDVHHNIVERKYGIKFDSMDFSEHDKEFTGEIEKLQSEVEKYCKAFENAKNERDCKIAEYQKKIEELEEYTDSLRRSIDRKQDAINQIDSIICELFGIAHNGDIYSDDFKKLLKEKSAVGKTVADFIPTEPIKVADMLINAEGEYEHSPIAKALCKENKGTYRIFDIGELRQIAEHLLVYCNHNGEVEE